MTGRDTDLTQALNLAGKTGNLYLSPDETVVLSEENPLDVPFKVGKHSILPSDAVSDGDAAFVPKTQDAQDAQSEIAEEAGSLRRHRGLIVFLVLLVTCALVAAAAWFIYQYRQHQEALAAHPVWVQVDAPGYDLADSRIPFHVEGVDMDNKGVDVVAFAGPDGTGIELSPGSYVITVGVFAAA